MFLSMKGFAALIVVVAVIAGPILFAPHGIIRRRAKTRHRKNASSQTTRPDRLNVEARSENFPDQDAA